MPPETRLARAPRPPPPPRPTVPHPPLPSALRPPLQLARRTAGRRSRTSAGPGAPGWRLAAVLTSPPGCRADVAGRGRRAGARLIASRLAACGQRERGWRDGGGAARPAARPALRCRAPGRPHVAQRGALPGLRGGGRNPGDDHEEVRGARQGGSRPPLLLRSKHPG